MDSNEKKGNCIQDQDSHQINKNNINNFGNKTNMQKFRVKKYKF